MSLEIVDSGEKGQQGHLWVRLSAVPGAFLTDKCTFMALCLDRWRRLENCPVGRRRCVPGRERGWTGTDRFEAWLVLAEEKWVSRL